MMKMKRVIFWTLFVMVAFTVVMNMVYLASVTHVHVEHDVAKNFTLKKTGWKVPELTGQMLPVQCAGLGRRAQWVCANYYWGSAGETLERKDIWGKTIGKNPCAFFRAHIRLLELTEFDSPANWKSFKIGLAACETV
ncbi:hypothetical protein GL267_003000 [Acidithiobacillus ferrianus]|uniref:Uncharacterized protein n=2 Tax=Acidithiobacillus ferrianus TaxID=2678518 RepID=A0A845UB15_9PROT|nr:hypothetical protein [Acidithiobacillus ferrianus]NDU43359.1 hypothetical protein [Acidithiobacillus ferrianus]